MTESDYFNYSFVIKNNKPKFKLSLKKEFLKKDKPFFTSANGKKMPISSSSEKYFKYYFLGSFFITCGFAFYLFQLKKEKAPDNSIKQYFYFGLMSVFFSASGLLHWYNLKASIPVIASVLTQESTVFLIGISMFLFQPKKLIIEIVRNSINKIKLVFIMALIIFLAILFGFMGLKITNPLISSLLSLSVPIITILFGKIFFKENLNSNILVSLLLISIGAFLLYLDLNHFYN